MNKLIPLSEYVMQQRQKDEFGIIIPKYQLYQDIYNYTKFLRQPLTLGMFVPVDDEGEVLNYDEIRVSVQEGTETWDIWTNAKERVLFADAVTIDRSPYQSTQRLIIDLAIDPVFRIYTELLFWNGAVEKQEFTNNKNLTIEDLVKYNLPLTPSALKIIGKE